MFCMSSRSSESDRRDIFLVRKIWCESKYCLFMKQLETCFFSFKLRRNDKYAKKKREKKIWYFAETCKMKEMFSLKSEWEHRVVWHSVNKEPVWWITTTHAAYKHAVIKLTNMNQREILLKLNSCHQFTSRS